MGCTSADVSVRGPEKGPTNQHGDSLWLQHGFKLNLEKSPPFAMSNTVVWSGLQDIYAWTQHKYDHEIRSACGPDYKQIFY